MSHTIKYHLSRRGCTSWVFSGLYDCGMDSKLLLAYVTLTILQLTLSGWSFSLYRLESGDRWEYTSKPCRLQQDIW